MADVHNVNHINQLDVTFSTEMKDRHSFFFMLIKNIAAMKNAPLSDLERGIILAFRNILFLHISKISKSAISLTA